MEDDGFIARKEAWNGNGLFVVILCGRFQRDKRYLGGRSCCRLKLIDCSGLFVNLSLLSTRSFNVI